MYIKSLVIRKNGEGGQIIRDVTFTKGVSLIVDETSESNLTESGNNVGKTTVLRLIDYCLGGRKEKIYRDLEFRNKAEDKNNVERFLLDNQVVVELTLKKDIDDTDSEEIVIKRDFPKPKQKKKILTINGEVFNTDKDFSKELEKQLLGLSLDKPSFREIISRNIRHEANALSKTLKPLHQSTTAIKYEAMYYFWLGIPYEQEIVNLKERLNVIKSDLGRTELEQGKLSAVKQEIYVYEDEIDKLEKQKNLFNFNENYAEDVDRLDGIKQELNALKTEIISLHLKKSLIIESQDELDKNAPNIEQGKVKHIYSEARRLLPNLHRKFEETLVFHQKMLTETKLFIGGELSDIEQQIDLYNKRQFELLKQEQTLSEKLVKAGVLEGLQSIIQKLTALYEKKGGSKKIEEILQKWNTETEEIKHKLGQLQNPEDMELIDERIKKFNRYFCEISKKLYDENFILSSDRDKNNNLTLGIAGSERNPGTGAKRGEIIAFDLAYIQFAEELNIPHLNFVLHDQIENIHDNQLLNILTDIMGEIKCQFITPVLQDKLPESVDLEEKFVLRLSQEDKLFRF